MPYGLSKSRIIAGMQCAKRLWLQVHRPELLQVTAQTQRSFDLGNELGETARSLYPTGQLIGEVFDRRKALESTREALAQCSTAPLFEAAFQYRHVLVRVDLLFNESDGLRVVEVKSTSSVKPYHINDSAIQAWVVENAGYPVQRMELAHVNSAFVYPGDKNYDGLLSFVDITDQAVKIKPQVSEWVDRLETVLDAQMPDIDPGAHCRKPFACPFYHHCNTDEPEYPVTLLSSRKAFITELKKERIRDVRDVPEHLLKTDAERRIWKATVSGQAIIDSEITRILKDLAYPRYYLDFETTGYVVPIWKGTRPYQGLPYQWSCHIEVTSGVFEHKEYLDVTGNPPMRDFAESLIGEMGISGPILVYSGYEAAVIKGLIEMYSDLADGLQKITSRLVDLLPLTRKYYYHPSMKKSWSIKAVLPTIAPDLDYKNLDEIQNGLMAQDAYSEIIHADTSEDRRESLRHKLLEYCKLDTLAMTRLVQFFENVTN